MERRWYGPDETWPEHDKPWWSAALREARESRWHLLTLSGHAWGRVVCDPSAPAGGRCTMLVFSTGRGGESVARDFMRRVRRCPHRALATVDGPADPARSRRPIARADLLVDAAVLWLDEHDAAVTAAHLLDVAAAAIDEIAAREAFDAALRADDRAASLRSAARSATAATGHADVVPAPSALVDEAVTEVDATEHADGADPSISREIARVRRRITRVRTRIHAL